MAVEGFALDGLDLQAGVYSITAMKHTPAKKRQEWADATDGDGSLLVRRPFSDNAQWDATIEIRAASRDAAHTALGLITDKLEEADRTILGIPLVHTPADSTKASTWYVLSGEIVEVPITIESGYFASPPVLAVSLTMICQPGGEGVEVTGPSTTFSTPVGSLPVPNVGGDMPAKTRIVVTDGAGKNRMYVAVAREYRFQAGADIHLTQSELTATNFIGTSTTRAESNSANVYRGTLATTPLAVCGTGAQPHIGVWRVLARVWASGAGVRLRLAYRAGDGYLKALEWETPPAEDAWCEIDMGVVDSPPAGLGTQRWTGQIEAYSDVGGDTLDVDYLILMPAGEGYSKATVSSALLPTPSSVVHRDEFDQPAGNATGKTAPVGGVYTGAGDAVDFTVDATAHALRRSELSDADVNTGRYLLSGAANQTGVMVQAEYTRISVGAGTGGVRHDGVLARYTDVSNWLKLVFVRTAGAPVGQQYSLALIKRVAGTVTTVASYNLGDYALGVVGPDGVGYRLKLIVYPSGRYYGYIDLASSSASTLYLSGVDADLATGGPLATGKVGVYDADTGTQVATRQLDNLTANPMTEDAVLYSGQSVEFRSDSVWREDATGVYGGELSPRGGLPSLDPAGDENRTNRIVVMARQGNIDEVSEANVTDSTTVQAFWTPRVRTLPR